jgi:hypothetical protein
MFHIFIVITQNFVFNVYSAQWMVQIIADDRELKLISPSQIPRSLRGNRSSIWFRDFFIDCETLT